MYGHLPTHPCGPRPQEQGGLCARLPGRPPFVPGRLGLLCNTCWSPTHTPTAQGTGGIITSCPLALRDKADAVRAFLAATARAYEWAAAHPVPAAACFLEAVQAEHADSPLAKPLDPELVRESQVRRLQGTTQSTARLHVQMHVVTKTKFRPTNARLGFRGVTMHVAVAWGWLRVNLPTASSTQSWCRSRRWANLTAGYWGTHCRPPSRTPYSHRQEYLSSHLLDPSTGRWGTMRPAVWSSFVDWLAEAGLLTTHVQVRIEFVYLLTCCTTVRCCNTGC